MYQHPTTRLFYRYIDIWTGVDKQPIPILLFLSLGYKLKWGVAKW